MRQLAWLQATPAPDPRSPRAKADTPRLSRIDQFKLSGTPAQMPPNPAPHVIGRLIEIGLCEATGMGIAPISWRQIDAWADRRGVALTGTEAGLLKRLSGAYVSMTHQAKDENCPPPYLRSLTRAERAAQDEALKFALRGR